jgi:hypothetical protein
MVPAHVSSTDQSPPAIEVVPALTVWVRGWLVVQVVGLVGVFGIAAWLNPYDEEGRARRLETHLQLGLPPCTFRSLTGLPCPSCGMTTSFALLMHGDLENSLRANAVGTLLALFGLALIPWSLASLLCKRLVFIGSVERTAIGVVLIFVVLLLTRWLVILGFGGF